MQESRMSQAVRGTRTARPRRRTLSDGERMDFFELLAKGRHTPVLCTDGVVGMLVEYPLRDAPGDLAGIEVPGETGLRWVAQRELHCAGGALRQAGSPLHPCDAGAEDGSADTV